MTVITAEQIDSEFIQQPRLAIVMNNTKAGPRGVPVWFEWDGEYFQCFSAKDAAKVRRIESDAGFSALVANHVNEPERWYAFDGKPQILDDGAFELAERLAQRYWTMDKPKHHQMITTWKEHAAALCRIRLKPHQIRTGS